MNDDSGAERLITQNLVAAAATYERTTDMTWSAVRQLAILIDLFCLHDRIAVLGRQAYSMLSRDSELMALGLDVVVLREFVSHPDLVKAASVRLATDLEGAPSIEDCEKLVRAMLQADRVERAFSLNPDDVDDFNAGVEWLRTFPSGRQDIQRALERDTHHHRAVTFVIRSFLYTTYAELNKIPLTPDEARIIACEKMVREEGSIRYRMRQALSKAFPDRFFTDDIEMTRAVTPLASIVFERSYPSRKNIPKEIQRLRTELAPLRKRIQETEEHLHWAEGHEEAKAKRKWQAVFQEIEAEFGRGEGLMTTEMKPLLTFGEGLLALGGGAAAADASALKLIPAAIKTLTLPLEKLSQFIRRKPAIELFRLGSSVPSSGRLKMATDALFGHVR
jgi:hypothetical protein